MRCSPTRVPPIHPASRPKSEFVMMDNVAGVTAPKYSSPTMTVQTSNANVRTLSPSVSRMTRGSAGLYLLIKQRFRRTLCTFFWCNTTTAETTRWGFIQDNQSYATRSVVEADSRRHNSLSYTTHLLPSSRERHTQARSTQTNQRSSGTVLN